jgi:Domain of unknown function (DUF4340)
MRRSTIVFLLLFVALAGLYYYLNNREEPADSTVTAEPGPEISYLFTSEQGSPTAIRIESKAGETVEVGRNAENVWTVILPIEAPADQGSAEAAASQVTTMRVLDRLPDILPDAVGLDVPEYKITVKFTSGVERIIEVGVITPTESGYYVRGDGNEIVIVSKSAVDSLLGLLGNPPYAATETPPPPTPEAVSPSTNTATPQP